LPIAKKLTPGFCRTAPFTPKSFLLYSPMRLGDPGAPIVFSFMSSIWAYRGKLKWPKRRQYSTLVNFSYTIRSSRRSLIKKATYNGNRSEIRWARVNKVISVKLKIFDFSTKNCVQLLKNQIHKGYYGSNRISTLFLRKRHVKCRHRTKTRLEMCIQRWLGVYKIKIFENLRISFRV
jgi:hypothetical protein